jgi:hypothetical protein
MDNLCYAIGIPPQLPDRGEIADYSHVRKRTPYPHPTKGPPGQSPVDSQGRKNQLQIDEISPQPSQDNIIPGASGSAGHERPAPVWSPPAALCVGATTARSSAAAAPFSTPFTVAATSFRLQLRSHHHPPPHHRRVQSDAPLCHSVRLLSFQ